MHDIINGEIHNEELKLSGMHHTPSFIQRNSIGSPIRGLQKEKKKEPTKLKSASLPLYQCERVSSFRLWARFSFSADHRNNVLVDAGTLDETIAERPF